MKCEQMHELFSPYLDRMTTQQEAQSLEAHLHVCPICKRQMEEMRVMCTLLKNLDTPQVPASFAEDLHKHLAQEKIKIFASKEIMTPKKPSWLVAGVAGIALSIGIYASSFLPFGTVVASIQNWVNKDSDKPPVVVADNNKILQEWINKENAVNPDPVAQVAINTGKKTNPNPTVALNPSKLETRLINAGNVAATAVKERVADKYLSQIKVENIDQSLQKVAQIADANGAQYSLRSGSYTMAAAAAGSTQVVALQVPKENADKVLSDLAAWGAGVPAQDPIDYSSAYDEAEKTLAGLELEIQNLQSQTDLSPDQQAQLQQLKYKQSNLLAEKQRIDNELNTVTIEVRLVETMNQ